MINMETPCPLKHLDHCTAENYVKVQSDLFASVPPPSNMQAQFKRTLLIQYQDKVSANEKQVNASRQADKKDGKGVTRLHMNCFIHRCATIITKVHEMTKVHVSGMVAMAIVERGPGKVEELRRIIGEKAVAKLRIRRIRFFTSSFFHPTNPAPLLPPTLLGRLAAFVLASRGRLQAIIQRQAHF